jgi:hypothetical protein
MRTIVALFTILFGFPCIAGALTCRKDDLAVCDQICIHIANEGPVSDEAQAVAVAESVLNRVYGNDLISKELPLHGRLVDGVWSVEGTMQGEAHLGGTATLRMRQRDGKILSICHGM